MVSRIKKRDGKIVNFKIEKISAAIFKAAESVGGSDQETADFLANEVAIQIRKDVVSVEVIQDVIEKTLIEHGHAKTAKSFILYRQKRAEARSSHGGLINEAIENMFSHKSKLSKLVDIKKIENYKNIFFKLKELQLSGELPTHQDYLGGNELSRDIYHKKYCLKDLHGNLIETKPEEVFVRLAAFMASVEDTHEKGIEYAKKFYTDLYNGSYLPGGRVIAGGGDLYRLKTLANCFVTLIEDDNIESIYKAAYDAARTYSYGGGIGIDLSILRPKDSVVHNAADKSTGAVSFMELYSLTTGLIGQSGRRGALMLTLDVKHPDIFDFINVKKNNNWVTEQIVKQCAWSGIFDKDQLTDIAKQVRENTQVRFANISIKVCDEFMQAVHEQTTYGKNKILVYEKNKYPQTDTTHYSYKMPSKDIKNYNLIREFKTIDEANLYLKDQFDIEVKPENLKNEKFRDLYGDHILDLGDKELAIRYSGDFLLYFHSDNTGEIKKLIKARDIWNLFIAGNFKTAEPGLIFWTTMAENSPSNYVGRPIASTNPCGEVPLEDGGACNLGSINLSRFVTSGYTEKSKIDWAGLKSATINLVRFLDNVISWNHVLNPLEKQRNAAEETRRIGLGFMGIADMLNQLGVGYDSDEGIKVMKQISEVIANTAYQASAEIAGEKGACKCFDFEKYKENPFFKESVKPEIQEIIKKNGMRNIAVLSIAPTGTISNAILGFKSEFKNYIGVSGGIEPIFALYYNRRSESFNKTFKVFHSTVQAYIDIKKLNEDTQRVKSDHELKNILPPNFFRTSHRISPDKRVQIQGICQQYIDHSISSTVNLPESINPEIISKIYLDAWKKKLKGITIYRDGSRYPILSVEQEQSEFQRFRSKNFEIQFKDRIENAQGDHVITLEDGSLTTPYHLIKHPVDGISVKEVIEILPLEKDIKEITTEKIQVLASGGEVVENPCPECGTGMRMTEGCATCPECGHSPCSVKL